MWKGTWDKSHSQGIKREGERDEEKGEMTSLEVLVEAEAAVVVRGLLALGGVGVLLRRSHDAGLLVITDALLEEVGLASQGDGLHEVKGVGGVVVLLVTEGNQKTVSDELDVLAHQLGVHAEQGNRESISQELLLDADGLDDDVLNHLLAGAVVQVREKQTSKVSVETLITGDELVGEGQTGHEATLLEPEDGGERAREEDTLDSSKSNQTLGKGGLAILNPLDSPVGLLGNAGD